MGLSIKGRVKKKTKKAQSVKIEPLYLIFFVINALFGNRSRVQGSEVQGLEIVGSPHKSELCTILRKYSIR